jgi:TolA-binding protein
VTRPTKYSLIAAMLALPALAGAQDAGVPAADAGPQSGTVQSGTVDGTVQSGTVQSGTVTGTQQGTVAPQAQAPALPSFLDTTDTRIVDERPPPTSAQVAALREMEAEVDRFTKAGGAYRNTVVSLVRREYLRQRRGRNRWYGRQIAEEERLLDEARERAIQQFERFIRRYPDDPTYTADAMFRLGELYFERSAIQFQQEYDRLQLLADQGEDVELPEQPDFNPTIELYQRLLRNFPDYRRRDGVFYLIGYCLNEMGKIDEALRAWLNLVCANTYTYHPDRFAEEREEEALAEEDADAEADAEEEAEEEHPALGLDEEEEDPLTESGVFVNPYEGCQPVMEDAEFLSETWFRIGEYHFDDYGKEHALDLAIAAYNQILANPEDRNYNLALYKVAWAYYRASRYPEAIRHFGMLVQWSDDEQARTGAAGSELRPEAIQYLGIAFAYDDWNENGLPDTAEGQPSGIQRVQDGSLLPQDREWTADVYFALGQVYFDEAKYPDAIEVWRLALNKWPNHPKAPEITNQIRLALQNQNRFEDALAMQGELAQYGEGSNWWNANTDHPAEQREAEQLAEQALIATAIQQHQFAQRERRHCVESIQAGDEAGAVEQCQQAQVYYGNAADAYRQYLERYPNSPNAYELHYNLADALYWSERYEEAAVEYASVRDSNLDDVHLSESARRVVESLKRLVEAAKENGTLNIREDAPAPQGTPPTVRPVAMPELVQRLAQARELYIARVTDEQDTEGVRAAYEYNNALVLYWYGYWPQAKERFERIFEERCKGPYANETGLVAWENLRAMAIALNQRDEIERLASTLGERQCTFDPEGEPCPTGDELEAFCGETDNSSHRCCLADRDLTAIEFQHAVETYEEAEQAEAAGNSAQATQLYERSARMLVEAVNRTPGHEQAPIALEQAATALERTQRFDSARQLYQRIIDEVGPQTSDDAERQASLDRIVANAYFRVAYNANRGFEFETAVQNYRTLVDSPRFARSSDDKIEEFRRDALVNTAVIMERLQRYDQAIRYYREILGSNSADADLKRTAAYRIAEIAYNRNDNNRAIREYRDFIQRYRNDSDASELVVQSYWRIAQVRKRTRARGNTYKSALADVVQAYGRSGEERGSLAAEYAANAAFILANDSIDEFENFRIREGRHQVLETYLQSLADQIDEGARRAAELADEYKPVTEYGRPTWTIAAYVQQGRVYELLAKGVLNAPVPFLMTREMAQQLRGVRLNQETRDEIRFAVEDAVRQVLDQKTRPIECLAVARYALAARAARAGSLDTEFTRVAIDRLQAYGDQRIAECIAEAQAQDASFTAYQPGEFARAPRGQTMSIEADVTPPSLEAQ